MKKRICFILVLIMMVGNIFNTVSAENSIDMCAKNLYKLGLFKGVGTTLDGLPKFDLDRQATRSEAVTMLIRILGKEKEATDTYIETPFNDVPEWAKNYIGYAYDMGLTFGTSPTTFGADDSISASQYITFVLRALGYSSDTDFKWDRAWELSDNLGITNGTYNAADIALNRGDLAFISYNALYTNLNGENEFPLIKKAYPVYSTPVPSLYITIDNKIYRADKSLSSSVSRMELDRELKINKLENGDVYVNVTSIDELLLLATKTFSYGSPKPPHNNKFLDGTIEFGGEIVEHSDEMNYVRYKFDGFEEEVWKVQTGLTSSHFDYKYSMNGKSWSLDSGKLEELSNATVYIFDDIRVYRDSWCWVNINDLFEYFNIATQLEEAQAEDGTEMLKVIY